MKTANSSGVLFGRLSATFSRRAVTPPSPRMKANEMMLDHRRQPIRNWSAWLLAGIRDARNRLDQERNFVYGAGLGRFLAQSLPFTVRSLLGSPASLAPLLACPSARGGKPKGGKGGKGYHR